MKEWLLPLGLALLAGAAVWALDPLATEPHPEQTDPVVPVFEEGPVGTTPRDVLVVGEAPRQGAHLVHVDGVDVEGVFQGRTGLVPALACADCPPGPFTLVPPAKDAPRALRDGFVGVRATFYVFTDDGLLLASNAPLHERGRFEPHGQFVALQDRTWYVGDGQAPEGMEELPRFGEAARRLVANETVGAHMAARFQEHGLENWFDELTVAARIDALVQA